VPRGLCPAFEIGVSKTPVFQPIGFSQSKAKLDAELNRGAVIKLPSWTIHDLRRTAASGMAGRGTAPHVIEAVLNHRSGVIKGIASVYNQYSYQAEKKAALDLRRDKIATLTNDSASIANAAYGSQI
jgi:integrase